MVSRSILLALDSFACISIDCITKTQYIYRRALIIISLAATTGAKLTVLPRIGPPNACVGDQEHCPLVLTRRKLFSVVFNGAPVCSRF